MVSDAGSGGHAGPRNHWAVKRRQFLCGVLGLVLSVLSGCGGEANKAIGPTGTVTGLVTLKGSPLTKGRINFTNAKESAGGSGSLGEGGAYQLDEPIPVGDYDVFISFEFSPEALKDGVTADLLKEIPKKYRSAKTSKLTATVKEGENTCDFTLK
ncbi:MAG: hypothetical protein U0929_07915 [Planctomycetaceae bacterium]